MKKLITILTFLIIGFASYSQDVVGNRVIARQSVFIRDRWIDSVLVDTSLFLLHNRSIPTAGAVYDFVVGRMGSGGGSSTWGSITGTLSNQTDLQNALNAKQNTITFGTGVQTALGVNIGSAGAPVLFNGAGGTPSSMVGTNITGTATGLNIGGTAPAGTLTGTTLNSTVVTSSLTSVGALASGSLAAGFTPVGATIGGTGQSVYAVGDILYASTTTALSKLAATTSGFVLTSNGAGIAPSWQVLPSQNLIIQRAGVVSGSIQTWYTSNDSLYLEDIIGSTYVTVDKTTDSTIRISLPITGTPTGSKYLRDDFSWQTIAGGGDVSKVGTPVDNQIGVWTGDGTIEGDANLTFSSSTLFIADGSGQVIGNTAKLSVNGTSEFQIIGTTINTDASQLNAIFSATASSQSEIKFYRSKNATIGSATVVASGDRLGGITWYGAQETGTFSNANTAAQIRAEVAGTVTSGAGADMPGRIIIAITADGSGTLTDEVIINSAAITPANSNGQTLGTVSLPFASLALGSGGTINWNNGQVVSSVSGTDFRLTSGGIRIDALTSDRVLISSSTDQINSSSVTATELGYVGNVTSAIQTQLDGKVTKVGTPVNNQLGVWTGDGTIEGDVNLTFASSTLNIGVAGASTGLLTLSGVTSGTITIQPASAAGTYTLTLPTTDGAPSEFLQTNGSGVLTWAAGGAGGGAWGSITGTLSDQTDLQAALDLKAPLASPTFTGTVTIPTPFTLDAVSVLPTGTELNFVDGVTSSIQTQLDARVSSVGTLGATANAQGASISAGVLTIQPASGSFGGVISMGTQTLGTGVKTFGGVLSGSYSTTSTPTNDNLNVGASINAVTTTSSRYLFEAASTVAYRVGLVGNFNYAFLANNSYAGVVIAGSTLTEASSGTHALIAGMVIKPPVVTAGSAATTNMASLYIEDAPSGITPTGATYAQWNKAGLTRVAGLQAASITNDAGLASGTYTPTLTNVTNITASTAYDCQYLRVGNTVTVSGKVDIDVTLGAASELGLSLPIASAMTAEENLGGTASSPAAASLVSAIRADATNDRAAFVFTAVSLTNDSYFFEFTYQIK